jgi:hypothetical protein
MSLESTFHPLASWAVLFAVAATVALGAFV